jgi:predicted regulator of Ras-like GTPase activity (Roadblock/LC7/MglB family)
MTAALDPPDLLTTSPSDLGAHAVLRTLVDGLPGVRGALVASVDGRPVAAVLPSHDPSSTAAIVAASLGLGGRLADLAGDGSLQEIVVRSGSGYVVIYAVADRGVLTVLTASSVNLALLHLRARDARSELIEPVRRHLDAQPDAGRLDAAT